MGKKYPSPEKAKLSVVIPSYNAEKWIAPTLEHLWQAINQSKWKGIEILVIDDGSTDKTSQIARQALKDKKITVVTKKNEGRFLTRLNGLKKAQGDYVLFIDSRTFAEKNAFSFLTAQMKENPEAVVWNGHINIDRKGNLQARFWHAVTFIAWRRYFARPRLVHYGLKDFDYYPKGTTAFFAPRHLLLEAYDQFESGYNDLKLANDDSSLIRYIATQTDIYLDPRFAFTYNARTSLKAFAKQTLHRGIVFIDGFFKPGTRYYYFLWIYLVGLPLFLIASIFQPLLLLLIPIVLICMLVTCIFLRVPLKDAFSLVLLAPYFGLFYTIGLYKGIVLRTKQGETAV